MTGPVRLHVCPDGSYGFPNDGCLDTGADTDTGGVIDGRTDLPDARHVQVSDSGRVWLVDEYGAIVAWVSPDWLVYGRGAP